MKKIVLVVIVFAIVGLGLIPLQIVFDDGLLHLSVTVRSVSGATIRSASGQSFGKSGDDAQYVLDNLVPPEGGLYSAVQEPFTGAALEVPVPISYTTRGALLWRRTRYYQYSRLVVIVDYADGRRFGRLVEFPDLHLSRELSVEVP